MTAYLTINTIYLLFPELLVGLLAAAVYVVGAFVQNRAAFNIIALLGLATAIWLLVRQEMRLDVLVDGLVVTSGPLTIDALAQVIRFGSLSMGVLLVGAAWRAGPEALATEYLGSLLLAICGLMLVGAANELVLLFLAFELISIPTYILLFLGRSDVTSQEAATKYFLLSILSSALLLYGFALLYGASGSLQLDQMRQFLTISAEGGAGLLNLAPVALVLILAGLSFKMAAVPFHFYAPDVYQGTTAANAGLLAVVPKIAGLVGLVRVFVDVASAAVLATIGWQLMLAVAIVTMTLGNVLALWQNNVRRMMAYSSIAHAGYMLVGLAVALAASNVPGSSPYGVAAALFYLGVYSFATLGTFATLAALASEDRELNRVDELGGLAVRQPTLAMALAIFMFSLIGIPPLAGFWGKFRLVASALGLDEATFEPSVVQWFRILAVVTVLNAAISAGYYLRIVATMFFAAAEGDRPVRGRPGARVATIAAAVIVIYLGISPGQFWDATDQASTSVTRTDAALPASIHSRGPEQGLATTHPQASEL